MYLCVTQFGCMCIEVISITERPFTSGPHTEAVNMLAAIAMVLVNPLKYTC